MTKNWLAPAILALHLIGDGPAIAGDQSTGNAATSPADKKALLNGFRRYHSLCNHCHGPDGLGSSFGPSLVVKRPDPEHFKRIVLGGVPGKMKGYAQTRTSSSI